MVTMLIDQLSTGLAFLPLAALQGSAPAEMAEVVWQAKEEINRITTRFLEIGQGVAAGVAALAILAGFIMISTSHGSNARAENGRQAVIAGLTGLVGVALVSALVEIVTQVFPSLR